jgi:hypothetical protein
MKLRKSMEAIAIVIALASGTGLLIASQDTGRHVRYAGVVDETVESADIVAEVTGDGRTVTGKPCAVDTATVAGSEDTPEWCLRPLVETFDDLEQGGGDIEPGP